jgi:surfactin synthase thioesterase subunit
MTAMSTMRVFHPAPDAHGQLVCLPHAGGSAAYFFPLSRALTPDIAVRSVQYPGHQDRRDERCIESIFDLATEVVAALMPVADRPTALFGHSMGAILAFEIARLLEARGVQPSALFVSGRRAPSLHRDGTVHLRDDAGIIDEVRRLGGTDSAILGDEDLLRMALPAIRSDFKAAETYRFRPGDLLATPIFAHVGDQDPQATIEEVRAWADHTSTHFELTVHDGGHFYLTARIDRMAGAVSRVLSPKAGQVR